MAQPTPLLVGLDVHKDSNVRGPVSYAQRTKFVTLPVGDSQDRGSSHLPRSASQAAMIAHSFWAGR